MEQQNNSSTFKLKLKRAKERENSEKEKGKFELLPEMLISNCLLPFFDPKESKEFGKINARCYNCFVRYYETFIDSLITKYKVKIDGEFSTNQLYEQIGDKGHFVKLGLQNLEHYLIFSYWEWSWKHDKRYWGVVTPLNSILHKDIYHLDTVCLIDLEATISHVFHGHYKLYLNHCVCDFNEESTKLTVLLDKEPIKEFLYPTKEQKDNCEENKFIDEETGNNNILYKEFIADFDVNYDQNLDNNSGHELTVRFKNTDWYWKEDWLIDGFILELVDK